MCRPAACYGQGTQQLQAVVAASAVLWFCLNGMAGAEKPPSWLGVPVVTIDSSIATSGDSGMDQGLIAIEPTEIESTTVSQSAESLISSPSRDAVDAAAVRRFLNLHGQINPMASDFKPWWESSVSNPFQLAERSVVIDADGLLLDALQYSFQISAINENICIAQTGITRAAAQFDPTAFVESRFVRTSVPTGSSLDAGNNVSRLREEDFAFSGGFRQRAQTGAEIEFGQQVGLRDSNSQFFTPGNQGNSRLTLSFNQPLLNGAGQAFNRSLIVLAKLDTQIASENATSVIQDHLMAVQEAMWNLYFQRASLLLRIRNLQQAVVIHDWLQQRQDLDALFSQLKRTEAAVASRQAELARSVTAIRNAEDQLRFLVNSPQITEDKSNEIIPSQPPIVDHVPIALEDAVVTALQQRSEINEVARELDSARVRLNMARNEMLPTLDLVLESYLSGLRGSNDISGSWVDQFSVGEPSYSAGLRFEVPLQRRAAHANVQRHQAEIRMLGNRLSETISKLHTEVAAAVRETDTSHRELSARYVSMVSAEEYVDLISNRWRELPGDGYSANALLEDLLESQDRLLTEESAFAKAQIVYALSTTRLKRSIGTLLQIHEAEPLR